MGTAKADRRDQVLQYLRDRGTATEITEIAEGLGIHVNTVRFHLDTLLDRGQVLRTTADHDRPGRPPQLYAAARVMDPAGPRNYRLLAEILASGFGGASEGRLRPLDAGRQWGAREAVAQTPSRPAAGKNRAGRAINDLMRVLDQLDFAPERQAAPDSESLPVIGLHHCPFLELVETRADVVCPVHLGLMRGVLESWDAGVTVQRLEAFAEPDLCAAHLEFTEAS